MIVCSCNVISDADIEHALVAMMSAPQPALPTPGAVWRFLSHRVRCCGCAPLAIDTIYEKMEKLERRGLICPYVGKSMRGQLMRLTPRRRAEARRELAAQ